MLRKYRTLIITVSAALFAVAVIIGVGLSVYLIYIIPNKDLQAIVIPIVSAVYGGLITLVGVAWTIKDTNDKRKEDLIRIESERKEEERIRKERLILRLLYVQ